MPGQPPQELRDVGGVVLQVGVERDDDLSPRGVEAGQERRGLAGVLPEPDDAQLRMTRREPREKL